MGSQRGEKIELSTMCTRKKWGRNIRRGYKLWFEESADSNMNRPNRIRVGRQRDKIGGI